MRHGPHCSGGFVPAKTVTTGVLSADATWVAPVLFVTTVVARPTSAAKAPRPVSPPSATPADPATSYTNSSSPGPPVTSTGSPVLENRSSTIRA